MHFQKKTREQLRKLCPVDDCETRYYASQDFVDIYEDPKSFKKKGVKLESIHHREAYYTVGYFHDGKLIRMDYVSKRPKETYILWKDDLVQEAHTFLVLPNDRLIDSYIYSYNERKQILAIHWSSFPEGNGLWQPTINLHDDYEYDSEGLRLICRTRTSSAAHKPDQYVLYDREKERFLQRFTVSKTTLIEKRARKNDGTVVFEKMDGCGTKNCPHCDGRLSHILTVDLRNRPRINKTSACYKIPVMFCFGCLSDQTYTNTELTLPCTDLPFVNNAPFQFSGTTDEEKKENAFLLVGGQPDWLQNNDHPQCPICGEPMVYIMTIRSREEYSNGTDALMFGDSGNLYVFSCCEYIRVQMQCT